MIIYLITNIITNKKYVGQTHKSIEQRFKGHCNRVNKLNYLQNSIKTHGKENFTIIELATASSQSELNELEKQYIQLENTLYPNGYNLTLGGEGGLRSEEAKKNMSIGQAGKKSGKKGKTYSIKKIYITKKSLGIPHGRTNQLFPTGKCQIILTDKITGIQNEFQSPREAELAGFSSRSAIANVLSGISKSVRKYYVNHINSTPENESVG